jgi:hypothetical protein
LTGNVLIDSKIIYIVTVNQDGLTGRGRRPSGRKAMRFEKRRGLKKSG